MSYPYRVLEGHANQWYLFALRAIIDEGEKVTTRGRTTWEILHALTKLPDPRRRVLTVPFRRANPFFQALETVWILAGRADAEWLLYYNSQMAKYLDPLINNRPASFHGAYGERLVRWGEHDRLGPWVEPGCRNQVKDVIVQLLAEVTSRRAVMTIHNPHLDNPDTPTLDRPCNIAMSYQLRGGQLCAATFNRSNDLNLGLAFTNICQFTTIQEFIASALGAEVGQYTHFSSSLHVYEDDPIVQRVLDIHKMGSGMFGVSALAEKAQAALPRFDVYDYVQPAPMERWLTSHHGWSAITALDEVAGPKSRGGDPSTALEREVDAITCPYWHSVGRMALAWHVLKDLDRNPKMALVDALAYLGGMDAKDWLVACLEFLHRWACKRGEAQTFKTMVLEYSPFRDLPGPVLEFVLHDTGE